MKPTPRGPEAAADTASRGTSTASLPRRRALLGGLLAVGTAGLQAQPPRRPRRSQRGRSFLRGRQRCDAQGAVVFQTIYPGWYSGRTTHIHVKVLYGGRAALTSQFFLPDAVNEYLYTQLPSYRREQHRNVINRTDGIAMRAGDTVLGSLSEAGDRYIASLSLVVDPRSDVPVWRPGDGPPPWARDGDGPPPGFGGRPLLPVPQGAERAQAMVPTPKK